MGTQYSGTSYTNCMPSLSYSTPHRLTCPSLHTMHFAIRCPHSIPHLHCISILHYVLVGTRYIGTPYTNWMLSLSYSTPYTLTCPSLYTMRPAIRCLHPIPSPHYIFFPHYVLVGTRYSGTSYTYCTRILNYTTPYTSHAHPYTLCILL